MRLRMEPICVLGDIEMKLHDDCFDRCKMNEHKQYPCCSELSGTCELLRDDRPDEMDVARDWLIEQDEKP